MGLFNSKFGFGDNDDEFYYEDFNCDDQLKFKALVRFNKRIRDYNHIVHGSYTNYIISCRDLYEEECKNNKNDKNDLDLNK